MAVKMRSTRRSRNRETALVLKGGLRKGAEGRIGAGNVRRYEPRSVSRIIRVMDLERNAGR